MIYATMVPLVLSVITVALACGVITFIADEIYARAK